MIEYILIGFIVTAVLIWLIDYIRPWYQYHKFHRIRKSILHHRRERYISELQDRGYSSNQFMIELEKWDKVHVWKL